MQTQRPKSEMQSFDASVKVEKHILCASQYKDILAPFKPGNASDDKADSCVGLCDHA